MTPSASSRPAVRQGFVASTYSHIPSSVRISLTKHRPASRDSSSKPQQRLVQVHHAYTQQAMTAVRQAQQHACNQGSMFITPQHLLQGLLDLQDCIACQLLVSAGLDIAAVQKKLGADEGMVSSRMSAGELHWAPDAWTALSTAAAEAQEAGHKAAGSPHLLLGLLACGNKAITSILKKNDIEPLLLQKRVRATANICEEALANQPASATSQAAQLVQQYQQHVAKHGSAPPDGPAGMLGESSKEPNVMTPEDDDLYN
eukprot:GHRR01009040.1.p1 GENE.GHRR01009040.1~~GHRR01009040.1.p1  ORF type:complete len:258 (+),score=100.96 GHRR01009040.1:835-1608(+)